MEEIQQEMEAQKGARRAAASAFTQEWGRSQSPGNGQ